MSGRSTASRHTAAARPQATKPTGRSGDPAATYRGIYDALGEGKNCAAADREVADQLAKVLPGGRAGTKALVSMLRAFVQRASRMMFEADVAQFLVCGVELSLAEPVHAFLQRCSGPGGDRPLVIYLDDDPTAIALMRNAIGAADSYSCAALIDHRGPHSALMAPVDQRSEGGRVVTVGDRLDREQPIGLIHCGLLPHLADSADPSAVADLMGWWDLLLPEGSFLALTHFCLPEDNPQLAAVAGQIEDIFAASSLGAGAFLSPEDLTKLFRGHPLVQPGQQYRREVVPLARFWPGGPLLDRTAEAVEPLLWGGVARKGMPFGLLG